MLRKTKAISVILAAVMLLSACTSPETSSAVPDTSVSGTASEPVQSAIAPVDTSTTATIEAVDETEVPPAETADTAVTAEEALVPPETAETTSEAPAVTETAEVKEESTRTPDVTETAEVKEETSDTAEKTMEASAEADAPAETAEESTEISPPAETVTPPDPEEVTLSPQAAERLTSYGIDSERREKFYTRINGRADIPVIHISTKDEAEILSIKDYVDCLVDVIGCDQQYIIGAAEAGIRVRGNSTAYYGDENQIKRNLVPYRIKFNQKTNMLGLNGGAECKSWVLLKSNWNLIMDYTAFNLADAIFNGEYYYSDCTFVHLYINEKFTGVYLLAEQNQVNKNRVNISEPEENYQGTDIGYFVEIDNYAEDGDKPYFVVDYLEAEVTDIQGEKRQFVPAEYSIDSDIYSDQQTEFIGSYIKNVFKILYEATQKDNFLTLDENLKLIDANDKFDNAKDTVNAVMDLKSVVNMYLLYEICHDYDCGEGSFYMAVDFSQNSEMKRLTFTAPWDFNWAYNDSAARVYYAGAFNHMSFVNQYGDRTNPWFVCLMTEEWFREMVNEKWTECYDSGRIPNTLGEIEAYLKENETDLNRTDRWGTDNAYKLLDWVTKRCRWLDMEFSPEAE